MANCLSEFELSTLHFQATCNFACNQLQLHDTLMRQWNFTQYKLWAKVLDWQTSIKQIRQQNRLMKLDHHSSRFWKSSLQVSKIPLTFENHKQFQVLAYKDFTFTHAHLLLISWFDWDYSLIKSIIATRIRCEDDRKQKLGLELEQRIHLSLRRLRKFGL